ncbi:MAG: DMT family transporter, partial [bacterium]
MNAAQWLLLITLSLLWGMSFFLVEIGLREAQPMTIVFVRVAFAAAALWALAAARGRLVMPPLRTCGMLLVMGALNNVLPFALIVQGQVYIDSGMAAICNATVPLFTVLLAHFLTADERLSWQRLLGAIVGLVGVAVLVGPGALDGIGRGIGGEVVGQLLVLGAALSYALAAIYGKRFAELPALTAAAGMLTGSALLMLPLMLSVAMPPTLAFGAATWSALIGLALLSTALAYLVDFRLLAGAGATN